MFLVKIFLASLSLYLVACDGTIEPARPCYNVPLCARSRRCQVDECLIGDTCYSTLTNPTVFADAYNACISLNRTMMRLETDRDAFTLFSFVATEGDCSQRGADANAVFNAVWVGMMYDYRFPGNQPIVYNSSVANRDTKYAAYFTMTDCMVKLNAPALFVASDKQVARYTACQRAAA